MSYQKHILFDNILRLETRAHESFIESL